MDQNGSYRRKGGHLARKKLGIIVVLPSSPKNAAECSGMSYIQIHIYNINEKKNIKKR